MSTDWDEPRWICAPAVASKKFLRSSTTVDGTRSPSNKFLHSSTTVASTNGTRSSTPSVPQSVECAKTSRRLKPEKWRAAFDKEGRAVGFHKALKAIIAGGVDHSIRPEVWEYLLGCYSLNMSFDSRQQLRQARRNLYRELIEQCQAMHESVGSGKLAYTVGSKVMDARVISRQMSSKEADGGQEQPAFRDIEDGASTWQMDDVDMEVFEDSRETFEEGEQNPVESLSPAGSDGDDGSGSDSSGAEISDGNNSNFLRLPVRTLFPEYLVSQDCEKAKDDNATKSVKDEKTEAPSTVNEAEETKSSVQNGCKTVDGNHEEKVAEWLWTLHRIVVDVVRTDRHLKFYEDSRNMARMSDILAVYAWVDPATGYCQGMSDLLSPFILLYEDDADAFWCFESLLRRVRQNFQMEGPVGVMKQLQALTSILKLTDIQVFKHFVHIGADSFEFAFRMLLVLFRRELSFGEALCMWEMMWAADFDQGISWALEYNCPEKLIIKQAQQQDEDGMSPLYSGQEPLDLVDDEDGVNYLSKSPLCGLRAGNFWPRHSRHKVRTVSSLLGRAGDDELSVFVVAAILVLNRSKFFKEVHSMEDAIKAFNEIQMKIKVRHCIRTAISLRKKYQRRLVKQGTSETRGRQNNKQQHPQVEAGSRSCPPRL